MSIDQNDFLNKLNNAYVNYIQEHCSSVKISSENRIYNQILLSYLRTIVYMINVYFSIRNTEDTNFCTEQEAQILLDAINHILHTSFTVDFEIVDVTIISNIWDDTLIWADTNIWVD